MSINQGFYDYGQSISWPVLDTCTLLDNDGKLLPDGLLADLHVWLPESLAGGVFIGAVSGTQNLMSVLLQATDADKTPIASVSVIKSELGSTLSSYQLDPMVDGVVGWVVFGEEAKQFVGSYRFNGPAQSQIQPTSVVSYPDAGISSIGRSFTNEPLTGLVRLAGSGDISITQETVVIDDVKTKGIVFQLKQDLSTERNVFDVYRGQCNSRPESGTCEGGVPLEFVNGVGPDCCGRITLEFRGCAALSIVDGNECAVSIDCGISLTDACVTPKRLPGEDGKLPNEYDDLCAAEPLMFITHGEPDEELFTSFESSPPPDTPSENPEFSTRPPHSSELTHGLPYLISFHSKEAQNLGRMLLTCAGGSFVRSPTGYHISTSNNSVLRVRPKFVESFDWTCLFKKVSLDISPFTGATASLGINWKTSGVSKAKDILLASVSLEGKPTLSLRQVNSVNPKEWGPPIAVQSLEDIDMSKGLILSQTLLPTETGFESGWVRVSLIAVGDANPITLVNIPFQFIQSLENPVGHFVAFASKPGVQFNSMNIENYEGG